MASFRERVRDRVLDLLRESPKGLAYGDLRRILAAEFPDIGTTMLNRTISYLPKWVPQIVRPAYGLYAFSPVGCESGEIDSELLANPEWRFYAPLAAFLGELEGCARCVPLGGNRLGDQWGTPDVVGRISCEPGCMVPWGDMLVSAELKVDRIHVVRAFGQAANYRIFSHKSYVVVPVDSRADELRRLELLCVMFGIGLVLFDADAPADPRWQLRHRAALGQPDMTCFNEKLALLKDALYG